MLIFRVYKTTLLTRPPCNRKMRVVALIHHPLVTQQVLEHPGWWEPEPLERGPRRIPIRLSHPICPPRRSSR